MNIAGFDMWGFWRRKEGHEEALTYYFSHTAQTDPIIVHALMQLKTAKLLIDARMEQLKEASDEMD